MSRRLECNEVRVKIEILGSGGATLTPRPFCDCHVCIEARQRGVPYSRLGPAYFVHDVNLLIDTPEEIGVMLNRSGIQRVDAAVYSHWHPDHTSGMRVFESNIRFWNWPPETHCTPVYLPAQVASDFATWIGLEERAVYLESRHVLKVSRLAENGVIGLNGVSVRPILLAVGYVYAFLLGDGAANVLIAPDELFRWRPPSDLPPLDLAILPAGLFEFDPFNGQRIIPAEHPVLQEEATFRQTLEIVRRLKPQRTILSHIEEVNRLSYDDLTRLSQKLAEEQPELGTVTFAIDQQIITVGEGMG